MGYYLSEEHRLYIEHQIKSKQSDEVYDMVKLIAWLNRGEEEDEEKGYEVLAKIVELIEGKGGVLNVLR